MLDKLLPTKKTKELALEVPVTDYIPYACHYNDDSILTKNGELIQVIKITGFRSESIGSEELDLREVVRSAVRHNVQSNDFALWFHTVRRKRSLNPSGNYPPGFSKNLDTAWNERHQWDRTYVNELYISIVRDSKSTSFKDPKDFMLSLYFGALRKAHLNALEHHQAELERVVDGMLRTLEPFGAQRLTVVERESGFYSEQLQFFSKILNLAEASVPMPLEDISQYLATHKIAFGFNTLEVRGITGKHFGAIFTIKEYHELSGQALDKFLQLPQEFIVTQTLDFINCKKALKEFKEQKRMLEISGDSELLRLSGLENIVNSDTGSETDFGESQLTLFFINNDVEQLEKNISQAVRALSDLGIVATRRDLRLEECFWSQLPANFAYLSRLKAINTSRIGGMASLYNFPAGKLTDNLWGPAVVVLHTAKGTPYFFNFHDGNNGHTAIMGPFGSGKTVLTNFFISEAQKYNGRLFFFDQERASKVFIRAIGGYYVTIKPENASPEFAFNPLSIEDSEQNKAFLRQWMMYLASADGTEVTDAEKHLLAQAVERVYTLGPEQRRLSSVAPLFTGTLADKMAPWHGTGQYAHLFDNERADPILNGKVYGFGMSYVVANSITLGPILSYLLHRIEMALDGTPTIIVLDEAWKLVNNPIFAPRLEAWLDRMQQKNAIVIFATENIEDASKTELSRTIAQKIATQLFLPNFDAEKSSKAYKEVWGLSSEEYKMLMFMRSEKRHFMMKQNNNTIIAALNLADIKELDVLSGGDKTVEVMEDAIAEKGENPENWLPVFYEKIAQNKRHTLD